MNGSRVIESHGVEHTLDIGRRLGEALVQLGILTEADVLAALSLQARSATGLQDVVLEGKGVVVSEEGEKPIGPGDVVFVPPNETHQFRNTGSTTLKFLCLIPIKRG